MYQLRFVGINHRGGYRFIAADITNLLKPIQENRLGRHRVRNHHSSNQKTGKSAIRGVGKKEGTLSRRKFWRCKYKPKTIVIKLPNSHYSDRLLEQSPGERTLPDPCTFTITDRIPANNRAVDKDQSNGMIVVIKNHRTAGYFCLIFRRLRPPTPDT